MHANGKRSAARVFRNTCASVLVCSLAACNNGGELPAGPEKTAPPPPIVVESGSFEITAVSGFNGCGSGTNFDGIYDVVIDSLSCTLGNWTGSWDPASVTADLESPHNVQNLRDCTVRAWTSVNITFSSENAFWGTIVYRKRVSGTCGCCTQCTSSWTITAVRVTP